MAERNEQEKTEKPTGKRQSDAKKRGNVFQSKDVSIVVVLLGVFTMTRFMTPHIYTTIRGYLAQIIIDIGGDVAQFLSPQLLTVTVISLLKCVLPFLLIIVVLGIPSYEARTRFNVVSQALQPGLSELNPVTSIKNLLSSKEMAELLKDLTKASLLLVLLHNPLRGDTVPVVRMVDMNPFDSAAYMMNVVFNLVIKIHMVLTVIAFFDFLYQRWEYEQDPRMTKQEVKDEYKQTEGNPETKGRIRQTQRQIVLSRAIQRVPQTDVIVRNPTHFVVALKYDPDRLGAPIVLAKGQDKLVLRIIKVGKKNDIAAIENRPFARALYVSCGLDREIPAELYSAVAEVLVFIYKASHREDMFK